MYFEKLISIKLINFSTTQILPKQAMKVTEQPNFCIKMVSSNWNCLIFRIKKYDSQNYYDQNKGRGYNQRDQFIIMKLTI